MMFHRIVVPLDGSSLAEQALPVATRIARASIVLLCVLITLADPDWGPAGGVPFDHQVITDEERAEAMAYLSHVENLNDLEGLGIVTEIAEGEEGRELEAEEKFGGCDVIVMATHGRGGPQRWVLGSVTERVLHRTKLPLLIVRPQIVAK